MTRKSSNVGRASSNVNGSSSTSFRRSNATIDGADDSCQGKSLPRIVQNGQTSTYGDQTTSSLTPPTVARNGTYSPLRVVGRDGDSRTSYMTESDNTNLDSEVETVSPINTENSSRDKRLRGGLSTEHRDFQNFVRQTSSTPYSAEKNDIKAAFLQGTFDLTERLMHEKLNVPTSRRNSVQRQIAVTYREGLYDDLDRTSSNDFSSVLGDSNSPVYSSRNVSDKISPRSPIPTPLRENSSRIGNRKISAELSISYKPPFTSDSSLSFRRSQNPCSGPGPGPISSSSSSSRTVSPEKNYFSQMTSSQSQSVLLQPLRDRDR